MNRKRQHDEALQAIHTELTRLRAAQEEDLRHAHQRIEQLEAELQDERRRVRELADQMTHLIDELGEARKLWRHAEKKAASPEP